MSDGVVVGESLGQRTVALLNIIGLLLSVVLIVSISLETFSDSSFFERGVYFRLQFFICLYFLLDFLILLAISPDKKIFLRRNFILFFVAIPYLNIFDYFSIHFSEEVTFLIRFIPIARGGAALVLLIKMIVKNKVTTLFLSYIIIFFSIIYFQTLVFYVFETGANPQVRSYSEAIWWAAMTVTTIGSNILPVTTVGKVATTTLAMVGMTTFPIFTVYVTSLVQGFSRKAPQLEPVPVPAPTKPAS